MLMSMSQELGKLTKCVEICETFVNCLKQRRTHFDFDGIKWVIKSNFFTLYIASRVHKMFPKPRIYVDCWVFAITIMYIRCTSLGNKYQLHWPKPSLNSSNWLVTNWLKSQDRKIIKNDQIVINKVLISSIEYIQCLDDHYNSKKRLIKIL